MIAPLPLVPHVPPVPVHTLVRCPGCARPVEITLIIDESLLPGIPVRAAALPTRCGEAAITFDAEHQGALEYGTNAVIARVGQHMLYYHAQSAQTPVPAPKPLTLSGVRRTMKQLLGDAVTIPADGRIRHREVDR